MSKQNRYPETNPVSKALSSLRFVASLAMSPPFNRERFESCKRQILSLPVSPAETKRNKTILERASRYIEYGEIGAMHFELKLLQRNLESIMLLSNKAIV